MTSDEQEALSRAHDSSAIVILLRLTSGRFAVYNNARELCGIIDKIWYRGPWEEESLGMLTSDIQWPPESWRAPATEPKRQTVNLKELGLE